MSLERQIDLDGPVHYLDFGGEGSPMLLVHGLGGAAVNWLAVGPELARKHRVFALDLPGFGRTPPHNRPPTLDRNRALVETFLDRVVREPAILVGNSMGGLISTFVAATSPWKLNGLVLVDAALPSPKGSPVDRKVLMMFLLYMVPGLAEALLSRRARTTSARAQSEEMLKLCTVDIKRIPKDVIEAHYHLAEERRGMPWSDATFLRAARSLVPLVLRGKRVTKWLHKIETPTLVMHGTKDRLVPFAASKETCRIRPDFRFQVFDDIGHTPQLEAPDHFVSSLESWWEDVAKK